MGRLLIQFAGTNTTKALSETLPKNTIIVDEDLHQLRLHDGSTAGGHLIGGSSGSGVPVGTIIPFAGNSIPQGYLLCDGSAVSRTTYAALFAAIGTTYGAGNGNTTFNLPNYTNTKLITANTFNVVGNGYSIGLASSASGTRDRSLSGSPYSAGIQDYTGANRAINTGNVGGYWEHASYGVTTEDGKSGMITKVSGKTIKLYIKY